MKYCFILIIFIASQAGIYAQYDKTYQPIKINSPLPTVYFQGMEQKAKSLADQQQIIDKKVAETFYLETLYGLRKLFLNGYVLYNDPLSAYVTEVAKKAFTSNPNALNGITFYVSKFSYANAYTYPDGTILINLGLLSILENEAQLAFIIAHEVAHFNKKHSIDAYNQQLILKEQKNDTETEKIAFLNLSYSREQESDADAYAVNILSNSEYDANQAMPALDCLGKEDTSLTIPRKDYYDLFNSEHFKIDSAWIKENNKFKPYGSSSKRSLGSVFDGDLDNLSSHPSFEKRIIAMQEMLKNIEYSADGKNVNILSPDFNSIRTIAQFECTKLASDEGEYFLSITLTSELLKKYPDNEFLLSTMLKTLYWAAYYKDINSLNYLEKDLPIYQRGRYWLIANLYKKADAASLKKMAYGFAKKYQKVLDKNDEFCFYLAMAVDQYLGKETANIFYTQYQNKFMSGKYILTVNEKMAQK